MRTYALTVKRTITHQFVVEARSGAEAAMKVGQTIAETPDVFTTGGVEIDRRMMPPELITVEGADRLDLDGTETPRTDPVTDTVTASDVATVTLT